jgi:hypothetical protein
MRARGVAFELGIPTSTWGSRVEVLGWEPLFPLRALIRPLWLPPLPLALKADYVREAGERFDRLWEARQHAVTIGQVRDRAWIEERYLSSPVLEYRVLANDEAWVVVRSEVEVGYLVDELGPPAALRNVIAAAVEDLRGRGAKRAQVLAAPGSPRAQLYRRMGFLYPRDRLLASWRPYASDLAREDFTEPRKMVVSGGDFDFA